MSIRQNDAAGKRIELLREVVSELTRLAAMANSNALGAMIEMHEVATAATIYGRRKYVDAGEGAGR